MRSAQTDVVLNDGAITTLEQWGNGGKILLCIHGMTSSRKSWQRLGVHFGGRYRVIAYDQRGHGGSSGITGPMTLHQSLLDLFSVLQHIGEPVHALVGHSWGGAVALAGGRRFDVSRVVALDPMIRQVDDAWYTEFLVELREIFAFEGSARAEEVRRHYADWHELDREGKVYSVAQMSTAPISGLQTENPPGSWDLRADLSDYPKPVLLLMAGQAESIVSAQDLAYVRDHVGGNARISVFEDQGHNLGRTDFPRVAREISAFLLPVA
ncbi:MAG: alpha/beta hydrolase [Candidatus Eremiobacteraeota bacterium]|nr:alpha/beta hydrolase [Candidatus Eremiobacteraeota bacterium]